MPGWQRLIGTLAVAGAFAGLSGAVVSPAIAARGAQVGPTATTATVDLPDSYGATVAEGPNQAVGDVLGLGHDQVIRLSGSKLEIVESQLFGGGVLESFEVGARPHFPKPYTASEDVNYYGLAKLAKVTGRTNDASRLAVAGGAIYVSTILGEDHSEAKGSVVRKYVVTQQGAKRVLEKKTERQLPKHEAITALDAYVHEGTDYVAVGLNVGGVRILRGDVDGMREIRAVHTDWTGRSGITQRDMTTAVGLGTDDQNRLILVAGKITFEHPAIVATDLRAGEKEGDGQVDPDKLHHTYLWKNNDRELNLIDLANNVFEWPDLIEFGRVGPNKKSVVAISWPTRNRTSFLYPENGLGWNWTDGTSPTTAVRYFTDADGENRVFVRRAPAGPILGMAADGGWQWHGDVPESYAGYGIAGFRPWSVTIDNRSRQDISLTPYHGSNRLDGCWLSDELETDRPLPSTRTDVSAGSTVGPFLTAQRTFGEGCEADKAGVLYAQVSPKGAPEQAEIVKLLGEVGGLRFDQEVGAGVLTVRGERDGHFGLRLVVTDQHEAPRPSTPTLTATRLTPAPVANHKVTPYLDDPTRPVYRFTVSNQNWKVPGADQLSNVTLPVPTVEASTDQDTWTALGTTTSPLAPTRAGTDITLGDSTFYWQTIPGATDYRYFRLTLPDGTVSETLDVKPIEAPAPFTKIHGGTFSGIKVSGTGAPRANALGQATLQMVMLDQHSAGVDPGANPGLYERIYFRDGTTKALLTGLGDPANPGDLIMVTPKAGQFAAANGADDAPPSAATAYVSTASKRYGQSVSAMWKPDGTGGKGFEFTVGIQPSTQNLVATGTGGDGITVPNGCATGACDFAIPRDDRPVLYRLNERSISLQLTTRAIPGTLSLPLVESKTPAELNRLLDDTLTFSPGKALLAHPQQFPANATITTHLVSDGDLVSAANLYARPRD